MKKILLVATEFAPGMIPFASSIINSLGEDSQMKIYAIVVCSGKYTYKGKINLTNNITYIEYPQSKIKKVLYKIYPYKIIKEIHKIQKRIQPDIIHYLTGDFSIAPYILFQRRNKQYFYTVHDLHPHEVNKMGIFATILHHYIIWGYRILTKKIDNLTTCSYTQYTELKKNFPKKNICYTHFPTLITEQIIKGNQQVPETIREKEYILFFGNVNYYKGIDLLTKAFQDSYLQKTCKLVIAGKGENHAGENIIRINRFIDDSELVDLFQKAALVVYPYRSATMSGVLSLAYYFHKPVLASAIPFFLEYTNKATTFFEAENTNSLKEKLEYCYKNRLYLSDNTIYDKTYSSMVLKEDYQSLYSQQNRIYILYDNIADDQSFIRKNIGIPITEIYSPICKHKFTTWFKGCQRALSISQKNDIIICWFDFQAVLCFWLCKILCLKRQIIGINIMLKDKETLKNKIVSYLYKQALISNNFKASVTSFTYGQWLNKKLDISNNFPIIHDVFHPNYSHNINAENNKPSIFCGGYNGRDWNFIMNIAKNMPNINFNLIMPQKIYLENSKNITANMNIFYDIPYAKFMDILCSSSIVCLPLNTEAPAGLIVLFQAAANKKLVITTDTETTQEYINSETGVRIPNDLKLWTKYIDYYLNHKKEAEEKANKLYFFLKEECSEINFVNKLRQLIES